MDEINKLNQKRGKHTKNLIGSVILLLMINARTINGETEMEETLESCCSYKSFKCNTEISPLEIKCYEKHLMMLVPYKYPDDNFTLIETDEGNIKEKVLLTGNTNYTEMKFCLGWRTEDGKTHEVAVVCYNYSYAYEDEFPEEADMYTVYIISGICLLISVVFSLITLAIYCTLPWLRDLQGKIIMSMLVSMSIGFLTLGSVQLFMIDISGSLCIFTGFTVYYWCLATFSWLHVSCFNIWRIVVLSRNQHKFFQNQKSLFGIYSLFGWGVPALFLFLAVMIEFIDTDTFSHIKPQIGESRCWFHSRKAVWIFFYGPLLIIILSNIFYFLSVVKRLHKVQKEQEKKKIKITTTIESAKNLELAEKSLKQLKKLNKMMYKNKLYLKLFFAMGITFIFELISDIYVYNLPHSLIPRILFQVTDIINALQGLILFIVLILTRRRVLEALFKKFNIPNKYLPFKNNNSQENDGDNSDNQNDDDDDDNDDNFLSTDDDEQNLTTNKDTQLQNSNKIVDEIQMT